jgi:thioredoxin-like negative regulator of GroEL
LRGQHLRILGNNRAPPRLFPLDPVPHRNSIVVSNPADPSAYAMQLIEVRRVSRRRKSLRYIVAATVAALAVGGWLTWEPALARYRVWKRQHAIGQAREFIARRDVANTQLALDVALHAGPAEPDTMRVAADMLEQVGAPQAMRLRRSVVRLAPESAADHAALVLSCLRFRDFNAAKDALHSIPTNVARQPAALKAALAYALATDDAPVADYILKQLRAESPNDDALAYTHAVLRLKMPRPEDREAAAAELEKLVARNPKLRIPVEREQAGAALLQKDYADAKRHLATILSSPEVTLSDRLQEANIELLVDQTPFSEVFGRVAPAAATNEADAATFLQWLVIQNRTDEARNWAESLPVTIRQTDSVQRMEADIAARRHDWDKLNLLLKTGVWGAIPAETLRLLGAAQAVDSPDHPNLRHDVWDMALNSASSSLPALNALVRLAAAWGWDAELEKAEWAITRSFPDQTWAFQGLFNFYREKKNTSGMRDVLGKLRDTDGSVVRYQHDWALLTLLTEPTSSWDGAKTALAEIYKSNPADPSYVTAYALALAQAGRATEAVAVIGKLPEADRDYPPRQPYLAYVYGAARMKADFERAQSLMKNVDYLPEERALTQRGAEALNRPAPKPAPAAKPAKS